MRRLRKFLARSRSERLLLLEAAGWLAVSRLAVLLLPFRRIAPRLGQHMIESDFESSDDALSRNIGWAVEAAARHVPWQAVCLPQAMAAKAMLRRRGIDCTLYLGVVTDEELKAHAWLRAGSRIITGREGFRSHTVVSTFS